MKPRTLWACQLVAVMISARVAPLARPIRLSRILFFDPSRASAAGLDAFFRDVFGSSFGLGLLVAALAAFLGGVFFAPVPPLGALAFFVAFFFVEAFGGA